MSNVTPLLNRLSKNVRSFEKAKADRDRARRKQGICLVCGDRPVDETGYCKNCRLLRIYSGDDR